MTVASMVSFEGSNIPDETGIFISTTPKWSPASNSFACAKTSVFSRI